MRNSNLKFDPEELRVASELLNSELVRSGLGRLSILPEKFKIVGGGHMMGTTRMGNDPGESVTDSWGRVHGIDNLYVAGSSLFPAAGAAQPDTYDCCLGTSIGGSSRGAN